MDNVTDESQLFNMQTEAECVVKRLYDAVLDVGEKLNHINSSHTKHLMTYDSKTMDIDDISLPTESVSTFPCLTSTPRSEYSKSELPSSIGDLLKQLHAEKQLNRQLEAKITKLEENVALENKLENTTGNSDCSRISDILEQVYDAQKTREEVMMERVKAANHDRDEALLRAKALKNASIRSEDNTTGSLSQNEMKTSNLLNVIERAKSTETIQQYSDILYQHVNEMRTKRLNQTAEEIKVLLEEKNGAVKKCKKLELEIKKIHKNLGTESNLDANKLQGDLQKTMEERDTSIKNLHHLETEVETLRVYYNINKSLAISQDQELMEKYNTYLMSVRQEAAKRIDESQRISGENQKLQEALRQVTLERNSFAIQNQKMTTELNEAYTKCKSLERLVKVLRKKLITNGITLVE